MGKDKSSRGNRSGRSGGNSSKRTNKNNNTSGKQTLEYKFAPNSSGKQQYATFALIQEKLWHECATFKHASDIQTEITSLTAVVISDPKLQNSTNADDALKARENEAFMQAYLVKVKNNETRQLMITDNRIQLASIIISKYCTAGMVELLRAETDYETKLKKEPIELLKRLQKLSHDPAASSYGYATLVRALNNFLLCKQGEHESADTFGHRIQDNANTVKKYLGDNWLDKFVETMPGYSDANATAQTELKKKGPEALQAFLTVQNAFHPKYQDLKTTLRSRYALGHDEYPRELMTAINVVHSTKVSPNYKPSSNRQREKEKEEKDKSSQNGQANSGGANFAQQQKDAIYCYCCGKPGHKVPKCPDKDKIAKQDWVGSKFQAYMQQTQQQQQEHTTPVTPSSSMRRSGQQNNQTNQNTPRASWSQQQQSVSFQGLQTPDFQEYQNFVKFQQFLQSDSGKGHKGFCGTQLGYDTEGYCLDQASVSDGSACGANKGMTMNNQVLTQLERGTVIALDTGSTFAATVNNVALCHDISLLENPTIMHTNSGLGKLGMVGRIPGMEGYAHISKDIMCNCFGFAHLSDQFHIWYDNQVKDSFFVDTPAGIIEFERQSNNLYEYEVTQEFLDAVAAMRREEGFDDTNPKFQLAQKKSVTGTPATTAGVAMSAPTVEENMKIIPQRERPGMERARQLYFNMGTPTIRTLLETIRKNRFRNCPVTERDIRNMILVYGEDVGALKGRTTRQRPKPPKVDWAAVPRLLVAHNKDLHFCMDLLFVNREVFLSGIDKSVRDRHLHHIPSRTTKSILTGLDKVLRSYNAGGFRIDVISCDREFEKVLEPVKEQLKITPNYSSAGEHQAEAERNNRVQKERMRIGNARLVYNRMPRQMLVPFCEESNHCLRIVPAKGGISEDLSPYTIMTHRHVDYETDLKYSFGSYVGANEDGDNTMKDRILDCIYLRPTRNLQGGHEVMDLRTGRVITRPRVWLLPMTQRVIDRVHELADKQKMKSLNIKHRGDKRFNASVWLAGVDGNEDSDDEWLDSDSDSDSDSVSSYDSDEEDEWEELDQNELADLLAEGSRPPAIANNDEPPPLMRRGQRGYDDDSSSDEDSDSDSDSEDEDDEDEDEEEQAEIPANDDDDDIPEDIREAVQQQEQQINETMAEIRQEETTATGRPRRTAKLPPKLRYPGIERTDFLQQEAQPKTAKTLYGYQFLMADIKKGLTPEERDAIIEDCHNITMQRIPGVGNQHEYTEIEGILLAQYIHELNDRVANGRFGKNGKCFAQQYLLNKGLKVFGESGRKAAMKEIGQLHDRVAFAPRDPATLTEEQMRKAQVALMFLTEKRDGTKKGRMVFNGKPTREYLGKEDSRSPTASHEGIVLTAVIDAHEGRDVASADVPNAFVQTPMPVDSEPVFMKITGALVDMLIEIAPEVYKPFVMFENGQKVLYTQVMKAIYGMLVASLLWYRKFRADLEGIGFEFNPYDPCICNRMIDGKQHTVRFHVDDLMSSHMDPKVNDEFIEWLNDMYGSLGPVKAVRGKIHDYLGMIFNFSEPGKLLLDMVDYVEKMLDEFSVEFDPNVTVSSPAADTLFKASTGAKLDKARAEEFHTFVAKGLFLCKRARPDVHPTVAVLCTRVQSPTESDWNALLRLMHYLDNTRDDLLVLSAENLQVIKWYVDAAFAVHPDFRSHTGAVAVLGQGGVITMSKKQKINTRSSTTAELVGADDASTMMLWTGLFMEAQGYKMSTILKQDNKSTIQLENNGKESSTQRTRAMNIRYFFLTDQVKQGNLVVEYCPTGDMIGDFMSKPLQGAAFQKFRDQIMGYAPPSDD